MAGKKRTASILTTDMKHCYVCKRHYPKSGSCELGFISPVSRCEVHHIFFGAYRKLSTEYGLIVPLCYEHHQGTNGVHGKNGHELDISLKVEAQKKFEELYGHEEWMRRFGRNYL